VNNLYSQIAILRAYASAIGWSAAFRLRFSDLRAKNRKNAAQCITLKLSNSAHPVVMRVGTSDREVLGQVFIEGEYEPVVLDHPRTILDLGANVGYASAYFLSRYPGCNVVAVEPDPGNYAVCCRNLAPFGERAKVVHAAAWVERARLVLERGVFRDGRDWTTQVRTAVTAEQESGGIEAYDVPTLLGLFHVSEIDLLKIDIERSELVLFSRNTEAWLPRVRNLCIELHGTDCEEVFFRAISKYSYHLCRSGDLTLCHNLRMER
jgi:FkbM family methyltransferase